MVCLLLLCLFASGRARAAVVLTLYNTVPLENVLGGNLEDGNVVQFLYAGPNGVPDLPDLYGAAGGDDILFLSTGGETRVGDGIFDDPDLDTGTLSKPGYIYDYSLIGEPAYVRFWNAPVLGDASYFGESAVYPLPTGVFDIASLDFMPVAGDQQVDVNFYPLKLYVMPEPSTLLMLGLGVAIIGRRLRRNGFLSLSMLLALVCSSFPSNHSLAQIPDSLEVTVRRPLANEAHGLLKGSSPEAARHGYPLVEGDRVELLDAGPDGQAGLPDANGLPTGDDRILFVTQVGQGMAPNLTESGRFSFTLRPAPRNGTRVFLRVFNATLPEEASHWGQSTCFTVSFPEVFVADRFGLWGTTQPVGPMMPGTDSDGDGVSDEDEFLANTHAADPSDFLSLRAANGPEGASIAAFGRAGRRYALWYTQDLGAPMPLWELLETSAILATDQELWWPHEATGAGTAGFYRISVSLPD